MKSKQDETEKNLANLPRQPYEKPKLRIIELVAEEVLATGCKIDFSTNNQGIAGATCAVAGACFDSLGS